MKSKGILLIIVITTLFIFGNTYLNSKKEYQTELSFKIGKVKITPTNSLELFNVNDEKISLWNYTLMDNEGIGVGDSIYKGACSEKLNVFKNNNATYKFYASLSPSGIFPRSWFCD